MKPTGKSRLKILLAALSILLHPSLHGQQPTPQPTPFRGFVAEVKKKPRIGDYVCLVETFDSKGQKGGYYASKPRFLAEPTWDGLGEPPFSMKEAYDAIINSPAGKKMKSAPTIHDTLQMKETGRWFYIFYFNPRPFAGPTGFESQFVVLMDGTVIEHKPMAELLKEGIK